MSAAVEADETVLLRDLGDRGTLRFKQTPKSRGYWIDPPEGKPVRCTSVTSVIGIIDKPGLTFWSEACGAAGALRAVRMGELDPAIHDDEEAIGVVRLLGLGMDAAKAKAAKRGLDVHDALEMWARTGDLPDPSDMDPEQRPYLRGLTLALLSLNPEPLLVEQVTCDPVIKVAGRLDLIATVDGKRTLVDLKTAKSGRGFSQAHVQCAAYRACEEALGEPPCDAGIVLAVGPDGSFCADEQLATEHTWRAVHECFEVMRDVQRPLDAMKRAAKKAVREAALGTEQGGK